MVAGLTPPRSRLRAEVVNESTVRFSGTIKNFVGSIRTIVRDTCKGHIDCVSDTILKQVMRPAFYYIVREPTAQDSGKLDDYRYSYYPIPTEQQKKADIDTTGTTLTINSLEWNAGAHGMPGTYVFGADVGLVDFISFDQEGTKTILNDESIDSAAIFRNEPFVLTGPLGDTTQIVVTFDVPLEPLTSVTATGSPLDSNAVDPWGRKKGRPVAVTDGSWVCPRPTGNPLQVRRYESCRALQFKGLP
ncbi:MAG: hypothetical protein GF344_03375 [Chitinivibrionales bacterium]|nr:hypothetical protein [Chitinivibrionales bacterium]